MKNTICIDFGTSTTKVAVSLDGGDPYAFQLGSDSGDPTFEFPMRSSILFCIDEIIYFGHRAVEKSTAQNPRLDSLKRRLTSGKINNLAAMTVPETLLNPTKFSFTVEDTLTLIIANALYYAHQSLKKTEDFGALDSVLYRFTRPAFDSVAEPERAEWVDQQMVRAISRALALEHNLPRDYKSEIEMKEARRLLDNCAESLDSSQVAKQGIREPVAAGLLLMSRFDNRRTLAAVMDIGAGTTDIALFVAVQPDGRPLVDRIRLLGTPVSIKKAGDYIDQLIIDEIVAKANFVLTKFDNVEIELNIRRWKENLFDFAAASPSLRGHTLNRLRRSDFVRTDGFLKFQRELEEGLFSVFESGAKQLDSFATMSQFPHKDIEVMPTGGGARLPIFDNLHSRCWECHPSNRRLWLEVQNAIPTNFPMYGAEFPRLAVAIGGAFDGCPL